MKITNTILKQIIREELQKEMFFGKGDITAHDVVNDPVSRADIESGLHSQNIKKYKKLALRAMEKIEDGDVNSITDEEDFALRQYVKSME